MTTVPNNAGPGDYPAAPCHLHGFTRAPGCPTCDRLDSAPVDEPVPFDTPLPFDALTLDLDELLSDVTAGDLLDVLLGSLGSSSTVDEMLSSLSAGGER